MREVITSLASDNDLISKVGHLPVYEQLGISLSLMLLAGLLHHLDKQMQSGFMDVGATLVGVCSFIVLWTALFG